MSKLLVISAIQRLPKTLERDFWLEYLNSENTPDDITLESFLGKVGAKKINNLLSNR